MKRIAEAAAVLHDMGSTVAFTAAAVGLKGFCIVLFVYGTEHAYHGDLPHQVWTLLCFISCFIILLQIYRLL
jgi:hypothetical protein